MCVSHFLAADVQPRSLLGLADGPHLAQMKDSELARLVYRDNIKLKHRTHCWKAGLVWFIYNLLCLL